MEKQTDDHVIAFVRPSFQSLATAEDVEKSTVEKSIVEKSTVIVGDGAVEKSIQYKCMRCSSVVYVTPSSKILCVACGHRVLSKVRTKVSVRFRAV